MWFMRHGWNCKIFIVITQGVNILNSKSTTMKHKQKQLSKTIAHALRHQPYLYELELDEEGWVNVDALLAGLQQRRRWHDITANDLQAVLDLPVKKRYEMANGRIRALYGHSTTSKIRKTPALPPAILFHGTAPETAVIILQEGLKPMSRQYVHLSVDIETAVQVGRRKATNPTILQIHAQQASQQGISFYQGHDLVWLADTIPAQFIEALSH